MLTLCCRLSLKSLYLASEVLQKARTCWSATAQVLGRTTYHLRSEWVLCLVPWSDSFVAAFNFNRISITTKIITDRYSVPFACLCWFFHISSLSGAIDQSNSCFSSTLAGQLHLNCHHWIVDPPNHRHRDYPSLCAGVQGFSCSFWMWFHRRPFSYFQRQNLRVVNSS